MDTSQGPAVVQQRMQRRRDRSLLLSAPGGAAERMEAYVDAEAADLKAQLAEEQRRSKEAAARMAADLLSARQELLATKRTLEQLQVNALRAGTASSDPGAGGARRQSTVAPAGLLGAALAFAPGAAAAGRASTFGGGGVLLASATRASMAAAERRMQLGSCFACGRVDGVHVMGPLEVAYVIFGIYLAVLVASALLGVVLRLRAQRRAGADAVKEHYVAGAGLMQFTWFFTMAASLYSGYSVSGIVNESFNQGWTSTRWIPGGGIRRGGMVEVRPGARYPAAAHGRAANDSGGRGHVGIGVYVGFLYLAPRFHALGKSRGYMRV
ncbi:hypothetical protein MNEG_14890 [Monoraphidium neglectum]|uniref:Uncharacterized protein n=1 Tax=Monoraphidium neglectum TaxID=145388 RepID=A0A0D2KAQ4_9CHLO|nr:hypothetical protein MNEG_14890 [Monoraphidium neglectum]KIY93073.1 hypothetical protein MNEG_14890 [Monoraphidium neglectum]|eukprot:XP_013892093.1 hypothetical protein MNEG_14890 [Monoraphidium neglectum]